MSEISSTQQLAIARLIEARARKLGMSRADLVRRAGYRNVAKGIRRLDELCNGNAASAKSLVEGLPEALDLPPDLVAQALEKTASELKERERVSWERAELEWRANFRPHVCILTERAVPQPIFVAALCHTDRLLYVEFDLEKADKLAYASKALAAVSKRIAQTNAIFPGFGSPIGFILNYSPDFAVRFDLDGTPKEVFGSAFRLGQAELFLKGGRAIGKHLSFYLIDNLTARP